LLRPLIMNGKPMNKRPMNGRYRVSIIEQTSRFGSRAT
jgi:hypothetical protein